MTQISMTAGNVADGQAREVPSWRVLVGDARERLAELKAGSVHTCITSPPYFGLRDYGTGEWEGGDPACEHRGAPQQSPRSTLAGNGHGPLRECSCGARRVDQQLGLEPTPDEYVQALVEVFRDVRRVLRDDGTVWLNLGDSYASSSTYNTTNTLHTENGWKQDGGHRPNAYRIPGCKPKDLLGIPWLVAFALRADGWYLRSEVIWSKPNPMPESVTDRPTKSHEQVFLLSKGPRYFYDADAIREPHEAKPQRRFTNGVGNERGIAVAKGTGLVAGIRDRTRDELAQDGHPHGRNKRSVWTVATQPYAGAHFATFPPKLIEPCVLAGCPDRACGDCGAPWSRLVGGTMIEPPSARTIGFEASCAHGAEPVPGVVLDPFAGSGMTGAVAMLHGRAFVGIELKPAYVRLAIDRLERVTSPLFSQ